VNTSGSAQTLLNQLLIGTTMGFSFFILHARYHWAQAIGVVLIAAGAVAGIVPVGKHTHQTSNNGNKVCLFQQSVFHIIKSS